MALLQRMPMILRPCAMRHIRFSCQQQVRAFSDKNTFDDKEQAMEELYVRVSIY